ncbi:MAG: HAD-IC family P-type ATPase, partial [Bacteroidota bacterium]
MLLSSTFTNGNILRILGKNHFYLRNAQVIESIAATTHIVFDKTGTLTDTGQQELIYEGIPLSEEDRRSIAALAAQSGHPLSRKLTALSDKTLFQALTGFREVQGKGIEGFVDGEPVAIGSLSFVRAKEEGEGPEQSGTRVYVSKGGIILGYFSVTHHYRRGTSELMQALRPGFKLSLLSGDNGWERPGLQALLGKEANLLFGQLPKNKTRYILKLQREGDKVMMVGDGLNDAGALRRSDTGIALSEDCNNFTPASDAILDSGKLF